MTLLDADRPVAVEPERDDPGRSPERVWWLSPVWITLLLVPAAIGSAAVFGDDMFRELWRSPKTVTGTTLLLLLAGGLSVTFGAAVVAAVRPVRPRPRRWPALTGREREILERASTVIFLLTLVGYVAFLAAGARSGLSIAQVMAAFGQEGVYDGTIKDTLGTIPGVTTLTQLGLVSVVLSALLLAQQPSATQWVRLGTVFVLALPRAFLLTERLALLELIVPLAVVFAMRLSASAVGRRIVGLAPVFALPFVTVVFAMFEYSRSWVFFRMRSNGGFAEFAIERLVGYYATAINNGALQMKYNSFPGRWPYETLAAFWSAPGIGQIELWSLLNGGRDDAAAYTDILTEHATPEFNNSSGLAAPFTDYGTVGAFVYFLAAGVVMALIFRAFRESSPFGITLYPLLFLGIIELPRYMNWSQGRVFPSLVAAIVIAILLRRHARETNGASP